VKIGWAMTGHRMRERAISLATILASTLLTLNPAHAGSVNRIEANGSQITISFDDLVEGVSTFSLVGPDRITIDVQGGKAGQGGDATGIVKAVRQGQYDPNTARIVLDLDRPAVIAAGSFAEDGKRLNLRLQSVGQTQIASGRQSFLPPENFRAEPARKSYSVKMPPGKPRESARLPRIYGPKDPDRPLVVIDAGHGGHDPGTVSPHGGKYEKDVVLAIAMAVRDRLVAGGRVRVALTRDSDEFLVLEERYGIARRLGADLFMSIHADAAANEDASGATVYTLSEVASDREAAKLATRENKANIINGINLGGATSDISSILIDLTQRETMNISADFAKLLHRESSGKMTFRKIPHRYASFVVLKALDTPSVLFETGYLTNKDDVAFLNSPQGRSKVAAGAASAIESHFARKLAMR
jgi:N-acetylmuramoyl-L-alanine amidase